MRYSRKGEQIWGINFRRNIARLDEVSYWAPLSRQCDLFRLSEAGTLTNVAPPSQRSIKVTPYLLGMLECAGEDRPNTQTGGEVSFDAKITLTPSLTFYMTYNTDCAQVEVDEVRVNLDRFSIFCQKSAPFF